MSIKALVFNCTLKKSPEISNTGALIEKVCDLFHDLDIETEVLRPVDYHIAFGTSSDEGNGDEWPVLLQKIKECDIFIIGSPIWLNTRSSIAQMVLERMMDTYNESNPVTGQFPMYGKVAGVIVTGFEDGARTTEAHTVFNLMHYGFTIPPNIDCYWVGKAGPGPSYIEDRGDRYLFTNRTARYMVHNLIHMARVLRNNPFPIDLKKLDEEAKMESDEEK